MDWTLSMDWFLYDNGLRQERVKNACKFISKSVLVQTSSKINRTKDVKTEPCPIN